MTSIICPPEIESNETAGCRCNGLEHDYMCDTFSARANSAPQTWMGQGYTGLQLMEKRAKKDPYVEFEHCPSGLRPPCTIDEATEPANRYAKMHPRNPDS